MNLEQLPPDPFTYADALASGVTRQQLRTAVARGLLITPSRSWYARSGPRIDAGERWDSVRSDHLRRLEQALRTHPGTAASHDSAALLHDLPIVVAPTAEVHIVQVDGFPSSRQLPGVTIHHSDSGPIPLTNTEGLRVTTMARTVADVLRTRRVPHALATLDQSLRQGQVSLQQVRAELDAQKRWTGKVRARKVLDLADPARESWGESHSYGVIAELEFPRPLPQIEILDETFTFVARVDGLLDHELVFFEVDGTVKYFLDPAQGEDAEQTVSRKLAEEATRHDSLERLGLVGARWTPDLAMRSPDDVGHRLRTAIAKARGNVFTGWVRWQGQLCRLPLLPR